MDIFKLIGDLGFPIAVALAGGYFVYLTIKLLLQGVLGSIRGMMGIIVALDNRVKTMNHDVIRIDTIVSNALGLKPDTDRIARADGKNDARRDWVIVKRTQKLKFYKYWYEQILCLSVYQRRWHSLLHR